MSDDKVKVLVYFNEPFGGSWRHNREKKRYEKVVEMDTETLEEDADGYLLQEVEDAVINGNWGWEKQ